MQTHTSTPVRKVHRAAVITADAIYTGDGALTPAVPDLGRSLHLILSGVSDFPDRFDRHISIVVDGVPLEVLAGQGGAARRLGWNHSEIGAWTVFHRSDGRTLALGVRQAMIPRHHFGILFGADTNPGVLAVILDRYHQATGHAWRGTFATTGLQGLRLAWAYSGDQPRWTAPHERDLAGAGRLEWHRPLTDDERSWGFVHTFDGRCSYLYAAHQAVVAWSELVPTGARPFDPVVPGYWWLRLPPALLDTLDDPLRPPVVRNVDDGVAQVTTPYAKLLHELADGIEVVDSRTGRPHRHMAAGIGVLRPWAEQLRDGLAKVETMPAGAMRTLLSSAIKRTYTDPIGGMQRPGMRVARPDWAHTLIDGWAAHLYRRILRVHTSQGVWPVSIKTDSLAYADGADTPQRRGETRPWATLSDALAVAGCTLGCGCADAATAPLGAFRHTSTVTAETWGVRRADR